MSRRQYKPLLGALEKDLFVLDGYVGINADASVNASTTSINGVAVTKTGTGQYTFTLADVANTMKFADLAFCSTSGTVDLVPQVQSFTGSSVVFTLMTGATATNPAAACGLFFIALCRNSELSK